MRARVLKSYFVKQCLEYLNILKIEILDIYVRCCVSREYCLYIVRDYFSKNVQCHIFTHVDKKETACMHVYSVFSIITPNI